MFGVSKRSLSQNSWPQAYFNLSKVRNIDKAPDCSLLSIVANFRYLKGQCTDQNCPLSHKVSLAKMPTCKFFLKGVCVNSECPYLHKKVNRSTEICENFSKGFCILADQVTTKFLSNTLLMSWLSVSQASRIRMYRFRGQCQEYKKGFYQRAPKQERD